MPSVVAIALRTVKNGPMRELNSAEVTLGGGIVGDLPVSEDRGLTLLSREQWQQVQRELGVELPWHTRRANVLVENLPLGELIGRRIRLGEIEMEVVDETRPCGLMDQIHRGLRSVLVPDHRGGVHGRVTRGGTLHVGDPVTVVE